MDNPFKNLFKKSDRSVLGVDIGPSSIKLVQLRKEKGKAVLETYGALALGPYAGIEVGRATHLSPEAVAEAVKDILRESNTTTKKSGISIPLASSLISIIEVPSVDEKQMADMIPIEARKYIPMPISEVTLDWWVLPKDRRMIDEETVQEADPKKKAVEKTEVLLVVIHNDALRDMREVIRLSGLDANFLEIEIFSTIRSVVEDEVNPVMIFDIGSASTKIYIIEKGLLRASHIVDRGSQDLTLAISRSLSMSVEEAENLKRTKGLAVGETNKDMQGVMLSTINYIFSEANRLLLSYQKKSNRNVSKILLTGGGSALKGLLELVGQSFQIEVIYSDPFAKIQAPVFLENVLREIGPEFAVAIGLALRKLQEID